MKKKTYIRKSQQQKIKKSVQKKTRDKFIVKYFVL